MRQFIFIALLSIGCAHAGPSVSRRLVEALPQDVFAQTAPIEAQIEQLRAAIETKETRLSREEGNERALKLEVKAAKAQVKADKAARKAARKRDDSTAVSAATEAMRASEAQLAELERRYDVSGELVDLLDAQLDQLERQLALKEAELQVVYALAVDAHIEPTDDAKYRQARAKAELKFQKARADVSDAEADFARAGGEDVPDPMIIIERDPAPAPAQ